MPVFSRRELVIGAASGATGGVAGMAAYRSFRGQLGRLFLGTSAPPPSRPSEKIVYNLPPELIPSFAHSGEDTIVRLFLPNIGKPSYLDVGACWPISGNNTYLFYAMGGRGVLVEPNIALIPELKAKRPEDIVLNIGIGLTEQKEADFHCYSDPGWNTFDKALVEKRIEKSGIRPRMVVKMPLIPINRVIEEHCGGKAPDFLSTDVEGLDLSILKTLDFDRFRPKVICAETIDEDWSRTLPIMGHDITDFLTDKGYEPRAMTYYNTIYIDKAQFSQAR